MARLQSPQGFLKYVLCSTPHSFGCGELINPHLQLCWFALGFRSSEQSRFGIIGENPDSRGNHLSWNLCSSIY